MDVPAPGHGTDGFSVKADGKPEGAGPEPNDGLPKPDGPRVEREEGLVEGLLGTEEQPIPPNTGHAQRARDLVGPGDPREDAWGNGLVGLGVDADRGMPLGETHGRCPVPRAVGHAPHDPGRPQRFTPRPGRNGDGRHPQLPQGTPRKMPHGRVLPSPLPKGPPNALFFPSEQPSPRRIPKTLTNNNPTRHNKPHHTTTLGRSTAFLVSQ